MGSFTEDELAEIQEIFLLYDERGDKKIHVSRIGEVLRVLGQNPTVLDVIKFERQLEPEEFINLDTFLPIYQATIKTNMSISVVDLIDGLRHFDKDGNGCITSAKIRHILTTMGEKMTDEEVEQLLYEQVDSQGNVNFEKFINLVINASS